MTEAGGTAPMGRQTYARVTILGVGKVDAMTKWQYPSLGKSRAMTE